MKSSAQTIHAAVRISDSLVLMLMLLLRRLFLNLLLTTTLHVSCYDLQHDDTVNKPALPRAKPPLSHTCLSYRKWQSFDTRSLATAFVSLSHEKLTSTH